MAGGQPQARKAYFESTKIKTFCLQKGLFSCFHQCFIYFFLGECINNLPKILLMAKKIFYLQSQSMILQKKMQPTREF